MTGDSSQSYHGLKSDDVAERIVQYGLNAIPPAKAESIARKLLKQFRNPLIYILLFALFVDSGIWLYEGAVGTPLEAIAILLILVANAGLGLWQNLKSEIALAKLASYTEPHCWVIRDGVLQKIESRQLVPDDIVRIEAGERLPADGKVLQNTGLVVDESIVTGESSPVTKENHSEVLSGTMAVRGAALYCVTQTGPNSNMGKLAAMLAGVERDETPLEKRLRVVGRKIAVVASVAATGLWITGIAFTGTDHINELFLFAVALAVAAVPESLPAVITFTLALGVERMARKHAVVRKMSAVEALGSVTVIATDKTGTLTENKMAVQALDCTDIQSTLLTLALANDADLVSGAGDPLELGILSYIKLQAPSLLESVAQNYTRIAGRPFDTQWKYMRTTVTNVSGEALSFFKGAPEVLLAMTTLGQAEQAQWRERIDAHASKGFRALAVARSAGAAEANLEWLGLVLLLDPPRPEVAESIRQARAAGIRVLMITGDHPATGLEIARQVGIVSDRVITGSALEAQNDQEFSHAVAHCNVFARVTPELKYRIVKTLQEQGEVVAVTGDGVNDAPALKAADVGVAMGQRGSDVAREVADLVLIDDNFATIVSAIEEGRNIFENIQKIMRFLFTSNLAEVLLVIMGSMVTFIAAANDAAFILPLTAAQILWINLLTDSIPALSITFDQNPGVLKFKPRAKTAALLDRNTLTFVFVAGLTGSAVALALLLVLPSFGFDHVTTQTAVFFYLTLVQLTIVYPARRANLLPERNSFVIAALLIALLLQMLVISVPALRDLFGLTALNWQLTGLVVILLLISWLVAETCSGVLRNRQTLN